MILISLLPPELRGKQASQGRLASRAKIAKYGGIFFAALTLFFYAQYLFDLRSLNGLKTQWASMEQEAAMADQLRVDIDTGVKAERGFLESYIASPLKATAMLAATSRLLPDSLWLMELRMSRKPHENTLLLKGVSLPSREQSSIQRIEKYLRDLKGVFPPNTELILTTSRQQKDKMELTLFTALFKWP